MEYSEWLHEPARSAIQKYSSTIRIHLHSFDVFSAFLNRFNFSSVEENTNFNRTITKAIKLLYCSHDADRTKIGEVEESMCILNAPKINFGDQTYWNSLWSKQHHTIWDLSASLRSDREWVVHWSASQWNQNHSLGQSSSKQLVSNKWCHGMQPTFLSTTWPYMKHEQLACVVYSVLCTRTLYAIFLWKSACIRSHSMFGTVVITQI